MANEATIYVNVTNEIGDTFREFWFGHSVHSDGKEGEGYTKVGDFKNNTVFGPFRIVLKKDTKDYWFVAWRDGKDGLYGFNEYWYKAEAFREKGNVLITLRGLHDNNVQTTIVQGGNEIGKPALVAYAVPS